MFRKNLLKGDFGKFLLSKTQLKYPFLAVILKVMAIGKDSESTAITWSTINSQTRMILESSSAPLESSLESSARSPFFVAVNLTVNLFALFICPVTSFVKKVTLLQAKALFRSIQNTPVLKKSVNPSIKACLFVLSWRVEKFRSRVRETITLLYNCPCKFQPFTSNRKITNLALLIIFAPHSKNKITKYKSSFVLRRNR